MRVVKAPRSRVWQADTDIEKIAEWWGSEGFTITTLEREVKVGGIWRLTMHGPDGVNYPNRMKYLDISEPVRLEYDHGSDEDPLMFQVITEFVDLGHNDGTQIISNFKFRSKEERDATSKHAIEGHSSTMRRLDALLSRQ